MRRNDSTPHFPAVIPPALSSKQQQKLRNRPLHAQPVRTDLPMHTDLPVHTVYTDRARRSHTAAMKTAADRRPWHALAGMAAPRHRRVSRMATVTDTMYLAPSPRPTLSNCASARAPRRGAGAGATRPTAALEVQTGEMGRRQ